MTLMVFITPMVAKCRKDYFRCVELGENIVHDLGGTWQHYSPGYCLQDVSVSDIYSSAPGRDRVSVSEVMVVDITSRLEIKPRELLALHSEYSRARIIEEKPISQESFSVAAPRLPAWRAGDGDDPGLQEAIAASLESARVQGEKQALLGGGGPSAFAPAVPAAQRDIADSQFPCAPARQAPGASLFKSITPPPSAQPAEKNLLSYGAPTPFTAAEASRAKTIRMLLSYFID